MTLPNSPVEAVRHCSRNPLSFAIVSVAVSLSFVPFLLAFRTGSAIAILGGLWTTCLLLGLALVTLFRFTMMVVAQGGSVPAIPEIVMTAKQPRAGLELGIGTFAVIVSAAAIVGASPTAFRAIGIGVAGTLLLYWYLLVAFALPELGANQRVIPAIRRSGGRLLGSPSSVVWFLFFSGLFTALAAITALLVVLYLPGVLGLLAAQITVEREETGSGETR